MTEPIRLLIVGGHALFRDCLVATLGRRRRLQVVAQAEDEGQALSQARTCRPDVAIIDFDETPAGQDVIAELNHLGCRPLVLASTDVTAANQALEAGARAWLDKDYRLPEFERAIERVHHGEIVVSVPARNFQQALSRDPARRGPAPTDLTERELDVVKLVAQGQTNAEIARRLCITEHTVKGHLAKILGKLELQNRVQLATYALQSGLADRTPDEGLPVHRVSVGPPERLRP